MRLKHIVVGALVSLCSLVLPSLVHAQQLKPLEVERDVNGVDMLSGKIRIEQPLTSIPGAGNLQLDLLQNLQPFLSGNISPTPGAVINSNFSLNGLRDTSESFSCRDDDCTSKKRSGSQLIIDFANKTFEYYEGHSGTTIVYDQQNFVQNVLVGGSGFAFFPSSVSFPSGENHGYSYDVFVASNQYVHRRLNTITSTTGYTLKVTYVSPTWGTLGWGVVADTSLYKSTDLTTPLARHTYSGDMITDLAGRQWTCVGCSNATSGVTNTTAYRFRLPSETTDTIEASAQSRQYGSISHSNWVTGIVRDGVTYNYTYIPGTQLQHSTISKVTVTGPNGYSRVSNITNRYSGTSSRSNIASEVDALGRITSYVHDNDNRPIKVTYPEGNSASVQYDGLGNIIQSRQTAKVGSGLPDIVLTATYPFAGPPCFAITCFRPLSTVDAKGNKSDYTWADHGDMLTRVEPANAQGVRLKTTYEYNATGYPIRLMREKKCGVNAGNTALTCDTADLVINDYTYWNSTFLIASETVTDPALGIVATTTYSYDNAGRRLSVDGPLPGNSDTSWIRYDIAGRKTWEITPVGSSGLHAATRFTYRPADDQPTKIENGALTTPTDINLVISNTTDLAYDNRRLKISQSLSAGGTTYGYTRFGYDTLNRAECTAVRMNPVQWMGQDDACIPQTTDSNGPDRITKLNYDTASQLVKTQVAVGTTVAADDETNTYTLNGKLATVTDGENNRTTFEYDGHDRLSKTRYPIPALGSLTSSATDFEQLTYDLNGNVTQRRLRDGKLINSLFDNLNRVTLKDLPAPEMDVTYAYDNLGRISVLNRPSDGVNHAFSYDALGRLLGETQVFGGVSYQYDLAGRRTRTTWSDGFFVSTDFDFTGNVTAIRENGAISGIGVLARYTYDSLGRRTSLTRGNGVVTTTIFDPASRLLSLTLNPTGTAHDATFGFTYNPASQIATTTRSNDSYAWNGHYNITRPYAVNGLNQLTSAGSTALGYDGRGNLTVSGSSAYSYTSENRLKSAPGATLYYDASGRLLEYDTSISTRFYYDGANIAAEVANPSAAVLRRYVYGPGDDEPLVWYEGPGTADRRFPLADERGSVIALTNASGSVTNINAYDEYGIPAATNVGRFGYTGQAWLPEIGLYHYKARMYSPTLGRFMQTDPIGYGDGINWYDYVGGDPVNGVDKDGQVAETPWDVANIVIGVASAGANIATGNYGKAAVDVVGVIVDIAATAVPGVPGGAATGIKAVRGTKLVKKELGIVYKRINPATGRCYIGRCNSGSLFKRRQRDHDRQQGVKHDYEETDRGVETGRPLREREQQRLNESGGPTNRSNPNGGTENKRNEIAPCRGTRIGNSGTGSIC